MRLSVSLDWRDLWVGAYLAWGRRTVYVCPLPCVVVAVSWGPPLCEHPDPRCRRQGIACYLPDDAPGRPTEWLCPEHAVHAGYCAGCGCFTAGGPDDGRDLCEVCRADAGGDDWDDVAAEMEAGDWPEIPF